MYCGGPSWNGQLMGTAVRSPVSLSTVRFKVMMHCTSNRSLERETGDLTAVLTTCLSVRITCVYECAVVPSAGGSGLSGLVPDVVSLSTADHFGESWETLTQTGTGRGFQRVSKELGMHTGVASSMQRF